MSRYTFGSGQRFSGNMVQKTKPPSRGISKRVTKDNLRRADSANRLMNEDKSKSTKSRAGASLARTSGKRQNRIIITEKTETKPSVSKNTSSVYPTNSLPIGDYKFDYNSSNISKPVITSYLDNTKVKQSFNPSSVTSSLFGQSTSSSNFPKKIVATRESLGDSTRDDTSFPKSSFISKINDPVVRNTCILHLSLNLNKKAVFKAKPYVIYILNQAGSARF